MKGIALRGRDGGRDGQSFRLMRGINSALAWIHLDCWAVDQMLVVGCRQDMSSFCRRVVRGASLGQRL